MSGVPLKRKGILLSFSNKNVFYDFYFVIYLYILLNIDKNKEKMTMTLRHRNHVNQF